MSFMALDKWHSAHPCMFVPRRTPPGPMGHLCATGGRVILCTVTITCGAISPWNGRCWLNSVSINAKKGWRIFWSNRFVLHYQPSSRMGLLPWRCSR